MKEFYEARSRIVNSREVNVSLPRNRESFGRGLDIARRTLFKLLQEGPPKKLGRVVIAGD